MNISRRSLFNLSILILSLTLFSCSTSKSTDQSSPNSGADNSALSNHDIAPESATEAFKHALASEQEGDLDKALYYYIQTLQFDANNPPVLLRIANIHALRGNTAIATRVYLQAIELDAELLEAHQGLGIVLLAERKHKQASAHFQKAILLDQQRLKAQGAGKQDDYYLLDNHSPIKSYTALAIIEDIQRNFSVARAYYNLVLRVDEKAANVLSNMGYSYYLTGELTAAEGYYKQAINADAQFKRAWTNLGLVYVRKGQYERAVNTFKQVMPEFDAYNDIGYFIMLDGNLDEAEYFFKKAINMSPRYFQKAYANLDLVQMKKRELWLLQQEAQGQVLAVEN